MKKVKKFFKKTSTKIITCSMVLVFVLNYFTPLFVFATGYTYTLTFKTSGNHTMASVDGHLKIDESFVDLRDSEETTIGTVSCNANNSECQIAVTNGPKGYINFGGQDFTLYMQGHSYNYEYLNANEEFLIQDYEEPHGPAETFDGTAYLIWSCKDGGTCFHYFNDIVINEDQSFPTTYYNINNVTDDLTGEKFSLDAKVKDFASSSAMDEWKNNYMINNNLEEDQIDPKKIDPEKILYGAVPFETVKEDMIKNGICESNLDDEELDRCVYDNMTAYERGTSLDPCGAKSGANSYTHNGDRLFKATVYTSDYVGVTLGNIKDFNYMPDFWDPMVLQDATDITESTKENPATLETVLLENTVTIKSKGLNGIEFKSVEALDVPSSAVSIEKDGNAFKITFSSHFYDRVVFKITGTNNKVYYLRIARVTLVGMDNFGPYTTNKKVFAKVYYPKDDSYKDYEVIFKVMYEDGTYEYIKGTHEKSIELVNGDEVESDETYGEKDNKLKIAVYSVNVKDDVVGVYMNVKKTGSTTDNYAGTFAGSKKGLYYDLEDSHSKNYRKINYNK